MLDKAVFIQGFMLLVLRTRFLAETMPKEQENLRKRMADAYYAYLRDRITTDQYQSAMGYFLVNAKWMPTGDEILERGGAKLSPIAAASAEWSRIVRAAQCGKSPQLSIVGAQALQEFGGVCRVGSAKENETSWLRKEFVGIYAEVARCNDQPDALQLPESEFRELPAQTSTPQVAEPVRYDLEPQTLDQLLSNINRRGIIDKTAVTPEAIAARSIGGPIQVPTA
ncbi:MAG: hypothetical protein AAGF24_01965 [Cyanobacteria bacterium P01_H01_bin.121]